MPEKPVSAMLACQDPISLPEWMEQADVTTETGLKEWDTCAPACVAQALGWHVSRLDGAPQPFNQANAYDNEMLVCRPHERDRILKALAEVLA